MPNNPKPEEKVSIAQAAGKGYTLALNLVVSSFIGLGLGLVLDKWLGTAPLFLLIGLCLGFAAGIYQMVKNTKF